MTNETNDEVKTPTPARRQGLAPAGNSLEQIRATTFLRSKGVDPRGPFQLDFWPADMRAMPNDYARSALFTVRNKREKRAPMQGMQLFHIEKAVRITYTGIELRADDDQLIWLQILHYARNRPLGEPIEFNLHRLLTDLGWPINQKYYKKARECISRLKASEVMLHNERIGGGVGLSLIDRYAFTDKRGGQSEYRVWVHENLIFLFAGDTYTRLVWETYKELTPIARKLYDYAASHAHPFPLRLDVFHSACASTCQLGPSWTQMVRKACAELVAAGLIYKCWVKDGAVHFVRQAPKDATRTVAKFDT